MATRQGRILSRSYALAALASLVPLVVIVLVLAVYQLTAQRDQLLAELEDDASGHNILLSGVTRSVRDYVHSLATWSEVYLAEHADTGLGAAARERAWSLPDARLLIRGDGEAADRPGAGLEIALAENLVPHMRFSHRGMPYVRWTYYFSAEQDLVSIFPVYEHRNLSGMFRQVASEDLFDLMLDDGIFARATPEANTGGGSYWTEAYRDPGGAGWVVAHGMPVYAGESFTGVVATTVPIDFLTGFLRAFDYPCGRLWLVNDRGQVLAASDGVTLSGLDLLNVADVLPTTLRDLPATELLAPSERLRAVNGTYLMAQSVGSAPWSLLFVVTQDELRSVLLPRLVPYAVILGGLALTLLLAQQVRRRLIIGPALAFLEFIRAESQDRQPAKPGLPGVWRPWLDAVSEAFEAKRESLRRVRASEQHFKSLAELHPIPVVIAGLDDRTILHCNQAYADLFGLPLEGVRGRDASAFYADIADRTRLLRDLREAGAVQGFEFRARRADGTTFPAAVTAHLIAFQDTRAVVAGVLDLTAQKQAEAEIARQREALHQSEQRFRTIAEAHPVPMYILRRSDRRILYASQRFAELMGMTLEEVYRHSSKHFYPNADERRRIAQALSRDHAIQDFEVTARRADGSLFAAAVTAQLIDYEGEEAGVFGVVDLSEQKRIEAEIARQREALHQSEKLNALGALLASVAHELNNPLSVVVGYATMMRDLAPDDSTRDRATRIHAAAERCARIVRTFLAMARQKPEARTALDLNHLVEAALEVAGYGLRTTDVEVSLDLADDLPETTGDADQLTLVLMNLIVNAQHALQTVPPPRRLEIATRREGSLVRLEIADNGPGIPAEARERIFEPFFTTKPQGVGTGIGLSVCHNVVTAHDGTISVAERPGGGSLFTIVLPGTVSGPPAAAPEAATPVPVRGRILIVEDEGEIAEVLAEMLGRDGHTVRVAESGRAALDQLRTAGADLIISDLHMPDVDGRELYRALVEAWPDGAERMVFITGDVLAADMSGFLSATGLPVFDKPIDPYDIRIKVRERLAALGPARDPAGSTAGPVQG